MLATDVNVALYRRQLEGGYRRLRFLPQIEQHFIADQHQRRLPITRAGLYLAAGVYAVFMLVKLAIDSGLFLAVTTGIRICIILSMLLTAYLLPRIALPWRDRLVSLNYLILAGGITGIEIVSYQSGYPIHYEGLIFGIFHCSLFSGLLMRRCSLVVGAISLIYISIAASFEVPAQTLNYQILFLLLTTILGLVATYMNEYSARGNFLRRSIMNISANFDELTGLASRAAFDRYLRQHLRQIAASEQQAQALVLVDIDHFKQLNDRRGHDTGDKCLQLVADILRRGVGGHPESVARWGGDELIAVLPAVSQEALVNTLERIRQNVDRLRMPNPDAPGGWLSISIGAVVFAPEQRIDEQVLFRQADAAMYEAKKQGRNRVLVNSLDISAEAACA